MSKLARQVVAWLCPSVTDRGGFGASIIVLVGGLLISAVAIAAIYSLH